MGRTKQARQPQRKSEERKPFQDDKSETQNRVYGPGNYFLSREEYYDVLAQCNLMEENACSQRCILDLVSARFNHLDCTIRTWTHAWTRCESMSHLQSDEKQNIINSLDGYCVQEDWDSIHPLLPPGTRANMGPVLGATMLYQFIFSKLIDSPFWFLDGKISPTDVDGDPQFHLRLQYLYERIREASVYKAAWWKSVTIGECNARSAFDNNPANTGLAQGTAVQRKATVESLTDELLGCRVFQLLLRPLEYKEDVSLRHEQLHRILHDAVNTILYTEGGMFGNTTIERLPDLPVFVHESDRMTSHMHHFTSPQNTPSFAALDGGRTLIVTRPGLVYSQMQALGHGRIFPPERVVKAEVLAEVKRPTKERVYRKGSTSGVAKPTKGRRAQRAKKLSASPSAADAKDDTGEHGEDREESVPLGKQIPPRRKTFWRQ
ncbi:hypothetical protein BO83DRAFT_444121 [Aspergillus eucalypticola CBS 122712]|uniref:Uncharacterized protein n=1 Tax=Aspergillus eucalypticola (strain CBS 122712 / IBT 29274) TaxID=1448314 RepID=A0A317VKU5_ASPEC|nr:uncharacterized protein BO83DRAFT_444121 [Aspergillus eucalypticola CBS 122712]PWY74984.1 hypothetical protein BO83DRAFT_444121 [Aspergillus eucalypticola CBS 122712]